MRINKIQDKSSFDLYFDIISEFNKKREGLAKEASGGQFARLITELGAGGASSQGGRATSELVQELVGGATTTATRGANEVAQLGGVFRAVRPGKIQAHIDKAFDSMRSEMSTWLKAIDEAAPDQQASILARYMDESGNLTEFATTELTKRVRQDLGRTMRAGGPEELVSAFVKGDLQDAAFRAGVRQAPVDEAAAGVRQTPVDEAAGGVRQTPVDEAAAGVRQAPADGTVPPTQVPPDAGAALRVLDDADPLLQQGVKQVDEVVENAVPLGVKTRAEIEQIISANPRILEEGTIFLNKTTGEWSYAARRVTPDGARPASELGEELAEFVGRTGNEVIDKIQQVFRNAGRNADNMAPGGQARIMEEAIQKARPLLDQIDNPAVKRKMTELFDNMSTQARGLAESGENAVSSIGKVEGNINLGPTQYGSGNVQIINGQFKQAKDYMKSANGSLGQLRRELDEVPPGPLRESMEGALDEATKRTLDDITEALNKLTTAAVKQGDEITELRRGLQEASERAGGQLDDAARRQAAQQAEGLAQVSKGLDDLAKTVDDLAKAAGKNAPPGTAGAINNAVATASWWGKAFALFVVGIGGFTVYKLMGYELPDWLPDLTPTPSPGPSPSPGPDGGGGGGIRPGRRRRRPAPETREQTWRNMGVTDPALLDTLAVSDPKSPFYDRRGGWIEAQKTIKRLKDSGRTGELNSFLNAQQKAYGKRFRMELKPPLVVPGSPTPLYYAYLNQRRQPAPNLSDPTGRTLALKEIVLNNGLADPEGRGLVSVFDVQHALVGDAQDAINYTAEEGIARGLAETGHHPLDPLGWLSDKRWDGRNRSEKFLRGEEFKARVDEATAGFSGARLSEADIEAIEEIMRQRRNASDRLDELRKYAKETQSLNPKNRLSELEDIFKSSNDKNDSTNITRSIDNQMLQKNADDFSKSYYKDALTDLNQDDKTLRSYFTGLGRLYDQRLEKRKADFKELYNVIDESGEDLIHAAHPNEVVLSDSIGRGALVENGLEQKRQTHGVALSAPTGNFRANYASRYEALEEITKLSFSS